MTVNATDAGPAASDAGAERLAFIAHSRFDAGWGAWLQKSLAGYRVPRRLVGREGRDGPVPSRLGAIFCDDGEISETRDLGATRRNLLRRSRYLLVVCSPAAAASEWVDEEVMEFKQLGNESRILCLIVDGEPNAVDQPGLESAECFCKSLRHRVGEDGALTDLRVEPIAADVRPGKDGRNGARLKLLAGLLGVGFDDLQQRDRRRRHWRRVQAAALAAAVAAAATFGIFETDRVSLEKARQRAGFAAEEARRLLGQGEIAGSIRTALDGLPPARSRTDSAVLDSLVWTLEESVHQLPLESVVHGHRGEVLFARYIARGDRLLTAGRDGTVRIRDVRTGTEIASHGVRHLRGIALSPDGDRVITPDADGTARIWDTATGTDVLVLPTAGSPVSFAAFDASGNRALTGGEDGTVQIRDARTAASISTLRGHTDDLTLAAFVAAGERVVTTSLDGTARLWEAQTGRLVSVLLEDQGPIWASTVGSTGKRLVVTSLHGTAVVVDIATGKVLATLGDEKRQYLAVDVDPLGKVIATASSAVSGDEYRQAQLWDAETGAQRATLEGHRHAVLSLDFSPTGDAVVTGSKDGTARVWSARTGEPLAVLRGHGGDVLQVTFSPSGDRIATTSADGTTRIWRHGTVAARLALPGGDTLTGPQVAFDRTGKRVLTFAGEGRAVVTSAETGKRLLALPEGAGFVLFSAFEPDGKGIVTTSYRGRIARWDASSGERLVSKQLEIAIRRASLSPTGKVLATGFDDDRIALWDGKTLEYRGLLQRTTSKGKSLDGKTTSIDFDATGERMAIAYAGRQAGRSAVARIWDVESAKELDTLSGHRDTVWTARFNGAGDTVVTTSSDRTARLWRIGPPLTEAQQAFVLRGHLDSVVAAAFSPTGERVVTASLDGTAKIWDTAGGTEVVTLRGHRGGVNDAAFSPSGALVATASSDRTVRLWEADTGRMVNLYRGHDDRVGSVRFSPSGDTLLSISTGQVLLWSTEPVDRNAVIFRARRLADRLSE